MSKVITLFPWQAAALRAGRLKAVVVRLKEQPPDDGWKVRCSGEWLYFEKSGHSIVDERLPHAVGDVVRLVQAIPQGAGATVSLGTATVTAVDVRRVREISELECEAALGVDPYSLHDAAYGRFCDHYLADHPGASLDDWCCVVTLEVSK